MNDAEFVFKQTEKERKRVARGAYNKKGGSRSKRCKLPSDGMTKAEREALNGKVMTYNIKKPMTWGQFKALPKDLQNEYMLMLTDEIGAGRSDVADMFGIGAQQLSDYINRNHHGSFYFKGKKRNEDVFMKWLCGDDGEEEVAKTEVATVKPVIVEMPEKKAFSNSFIERGKIELYGTAGEIFEKMISILGEGEKYRVSIEFEKSWIKSESCEVA